MGHFTPRWVLAVWFSCVVHHFFGCVPFPCFNFELAPARFNSDKQYSMRPRGVFARCHTLSPCMLSFYIPSVRPDLFSAPCHIPHHLFISVSALCRFSPSGISPVRFWSIFRLRFNYSIWRFRLELSTFRPVPFAARLSIFSLCSERAGEFPRGRSMCLVCISACLGRNSSSRDEPEGFCIFCRIRPPGVFVLVETSICYAIPQGASMQIHRFFRALALLGHACIAHMLTIWGILRPGVAC